MYRHRPKTTIIPAEAEIHEGCRFRLEVVSELFMVNPSNHERRVGRRL